MDYNQRLAMAQALFDKPAGDDLPNQKFASGSKVQVTDKMPRHMFHFESGFQGIVEYTYGQKYGGVDDVKSYSLIVLDSDGKPVNSIAWYEENQLTLLDDDLESGKSIINEYRKARS